MATTSFTSVRNEADRPGSILHQLARYGLRVRSRTTYSERLVKVRAD